MHTWQEPPGCSGRPKYLSAQTLHVGALYPMSQSHTGSLVDWSNSQIAANECPEAIEFGHGHGL